MFPTSAQARMAHLRPLASASTAPRVGGRGGKKAPPRVPPILPSSTTTSMSASTSAAAAAASSSSTSAAASVAAPLPSPPPIDIGELEVEKDANFCGPEGTPLARQPLPASSSSKPLRGLYHIHTFGCQMNVADSERMAGALEAAGWGPSQDGADGASVIIYNTCSIRDKAEQKVYSALGKQAKRKRAIMSRNRKSDSKGGGGGGGGVSSSSSSSSSSSPSAFLTNNDNNDLKLVLAGCVGSQEGAALLRRVPELDLVMGPHHANRIAELLERVDLGQQVVAVEPMEIEEDVALPRRGSTLTAWVNASFGCDEACTYCVVPRTRGSEQSRKPDDIRREMLSLGEAGYKEVTLLGQNIDAYGRDLPGAAADGSGRRAWTFTDLLRHVHDVPGIERIRFATSHPRYFTERLIRTCAELPKLCEFFHVPFQSGDDQVLREMARGYTAARYRRVADAIRRNMPDASISGDAIVGFPGETEEQFQKTIDLVRAVGFDRVNTAAYSPRPGTSAALRGDQVADLVKSDRLNRLNAVVDEVAEERAGRFLGRELEVLVEGTNPKASDVDGGNNGNNSNNTSAFGRSRHNKLVFFAGDGEDLRGSTVTVRVDKVHAYSLFGEMVAVVKRA